MCVYLYMYFGSIKSIFTDKDFEHWVVKCLDLGTRKKKKKPTKKEQNKTFEYRDKKKTKI